MADVRALLAAERTSRQIKHPHLTYSKNGALTCNIFNLNIKSEQLWPGHQKSAGHRKNVQRTSEQPIRPAKRKIEVLEQENEEAEQNKKQKSFEGSDNRLDTISNQPLLDTAGNVAVDETALRDLAPTKETANRTIEPIKAVQDLPVSNTSIDNGVDDEDWAAFERDIAPLVQPKYAAATIEAAPVSAAQLAEQQKSNPVQQREDEAEAEKEEESRRLEEEFEVMEEMEDRVKRLRDRREALRSGREVAQSTDLIPPVTGHNQAAEVAEADSSEDDEEDEWYS